MPASPINRMVRFSFSTLTADFDILLHDVVNMLSGDRRGEGEGEGRRKRRKCGKSGK